MIFFPLYKKQRQIDVLLAFPSSALTLGFYFFAPITGVMQLPWQHHVSSTCSVQPLFLFIPVSPQHQSYVCNVFKAVFGCFGEVLFAVQCLFSVPVALAAVNRLLGSCCFSYCCVSRSSCLLQVPPPPLLFLSQADVHPVSCRPMRLSVRYTVCDANID